MRAALAGALLPVNEGVQLGGAAGGAPGEGHVAVGHAGEVARDGRVLQAPAQQHAVALELLGEDGVEERVGAGVERQHEDGQHLGQGVVQA